MNPAEVMNCRNSLISELCSEKKQLIVVSVVTLVPTVSVRARKYYLLLHSFVTSKLATKVHMTTSLTYRVRMVCFKINDFVLNMVIQFLE